MTKKYFFKNEILPFNYTIYGNLTNSSIIDSSIFKYSTIPYTFSGDLSINSTSISSLIYTVPSGKTALINISNFMLRGIFNSNANFGTVAMSSGLNLFGGFSGLSAVPITGITKEYIGHSYQFSLGAFTKEASFSAEFSGGSLSIHAPNVSMSAISHSDGIFFEVPNFSGYGRWAIERPPFASLLKSTSFGSFYFVIKRDGITIQNNTSFNASFSTMTNFLSCGNDNYYLTKNVPADHVGYQTQIYTKRFNTPYAAAILSAGDKIEFNMNFYRNVLLSMAAPTPVEMAFFTYTPSSAANSWNLYNGYQLTYDIMVIEEDI